eukprot:TRINITY_DN12344_c0_g1_i1.p1 TRINITY_DN12344_c0_g1~~TRINITY_DN12344_c0_g1_i1.p1  ORF type:complete len:203 (+),score=35.04 TRINITY_DN12344_c0_g1_i1:849-1457(+)
MGQTSHVELFLEKDGLALIVRLLGASDGLLREKLLDVIHAVSGESQGAMVFVQQLNGQQVLQDMNPTTMTIMEHLMTLMCLSNLLLHASLVQGGYVRIKEVVDYSLKQMSNYCQPKHELLTVMQPYRFPIDQLGTARHPVETEEEAWEAVKNMISGQLDIIKACNESKSKGNRVFLSCRVQHITMMLAIGLIFQAYMKLPSQ